MWLGGNGTFCFREGNLQQLLSCFMPKLWFVLFILQREVCWGIPPMPRGCQGGVESPCSG